jgi:hypothetical protein
MLQQVLEREEWAKQTCLCGLGNFKKEGQTSQMMKGLVI